MLEITLNVNFSKIKAFVYPLKSFQAGIQNIRIAVTATEKKWSPMSSSYGAFTTPDIFSWVVSALEILNDRESEAIASLVKKTDLF